jgi:hypothetical protein
MVFQNGGKMKIKINAVVCFCLFLLLPCLADERANPIQYGQKRIILTANPKVVISGDTGTVKIRLSDRAGQVLVHLSVTAGSASLDDTATTDSDGIATVTGTFNGRNPVTIKATASGYLSGCVTVPIGWVEITEIDSNFAPSAERLSIKYSVHPQGFTANYAQLQIFKNGDAVNPIFTDTTIPRTGSGVDCKQNGTPGWDGKTDGGEYISPQDSDFTVRIQIAQNPPQNPPPQANKDEKPTKVEIEKITTNKADAKTKIYMNDPDHNEMIEASVFIKGKDGEGVLTEISMEGEWTFSDPDPANSKKADSYEYANGKFLGKKDDADAKYWAAHPERGIIGRLQDHLQKQDDCCRSKQGKDADLFQGVRSRR